MRKAAKESIRVGVEPRRLRTVRLRELGVRFLFGAAISIAAALVGMRFGHRAGGLFLSFPAILPASLTLIAEKHGDHPAKVNAIGAMIGAVGLAGFAVTALALVTRVPLAAALLAAALAWLALSTAVYFTAAYLLARAGRHPAAPDRAGSLRRRQTG